MLSSTCQCKAASQPPPSQKSSAYHSQPHSPYNETFAKEANTYYNRHLLQKKVSHCSINFTVSPLVVRPKPLSPKPILDLPLLRCRHDSSLAWKQLCYKETKVISIHNEYLQNPIQIQYFMFHIWKRNLHRILQPVSRFSSPSSL